jgi:predicted alpha/beta-fold hydrolase
MAEPFRPAWWLRNPHAQTIWSKFARRTPLPPSRRERWELRDGDFLELQRMEGGGDRPRLLLLHGLEGSPRSHYVRGFFTEAARRGWAADLLIFRSCGDEPNRLLRSYHSGETGDVDYVVRRLVAAEPGRPLVLAGVSLGANVLLKWLGERGDMVPREVARAAAISTPFDLARGSRFLERGFSRVYARHFLGTLKAKAREKLARFPGTIAWDRVAAVRTIWDFDDVATAPVHGFRDAPDYYARSSSIRFLAGIAIPTLLLSAADDPFLPSEVLDEVRAIAARNAHFTVEFSEHGGHVGFVSGALPWRPAFYAEARAVEFLEAGLRAR